MADFTVEDAKGLARQVEHYIKRPVVVCVPDTLSQRPGTRVVDMKIGVSGDITAAILEMAAEMLIEQAVKEIQAENCDCGPCRRRIDRLQRAVAILSAAEMPTQGGIN